MITLREYKKINNPARYMGGESGIVIKNNIDIRVCVASPDIYEASMSNLKVLNIYNKLNSLSNVWCERVFTPMPDYEGLLRSKYEILSTLESNTPINNMDIIIFVIDDVMQITNAINILNMGKIPILKERRDDNHPLICFTGSATLNPSPLKGFADIFLIGEIEAILDDFITTYSEFKSFSRKEKIKKIANIKGAYIGDDKSVQYVYTNELEYVPYNSFIVPSILNGIDLNVTKVARGCDMPYVICQEKFLYKDIEEKINPIYEMKDKIKRTGEKDVLIDTKHMWNLDSIRDIIYELKLDNDFKKSKINLLNVKFNINNLWTLDYLREGDIPTILTSGYITNTTKTTLKSNKKTEIMEVANSIFKAGFSEIKLIYIFGTPKENYEDLNQILNLANDIVNIYLSICPNTTKTKIVDIELIPFTAYPHTPLEWCKTNSPENLELKLRYIIDKNSNQHINIITHNQYMSCIRQMLLKGNEIVCKIIYDAWKNGAKMDNNEDMFCKEPWQIAIQKNKVNLKDYLDEIRFDERLPWDNVLIQTSKTELRNIFEKGIASK